MTITPEQLDNPPAGIGNMTRLAESVVLDIIRRDAPAIQTPVSVNADLLMFGWPGNEAVIPIAGHWTSDDTLLLADIIREAAMQYADGDPFWKAEGHEYACRTKALSDLLLADEFQAFIYRLENAVALFSPQKPSPHHQVNAFSNGHAVTWHPANTWGWLDDIIREVTGHSDHDNESLEVYTSAAQRQLLDQHTEAVCRAVQQVYDHCRAGQAPNAAAPAAA